MKKDHRLFDDFLIIIFLSGLFLPLLLTNNRAMSTIEQRKLAPFPELKGDKNAITHFSAKFEEFFKDHFGFRDRLAQAYYFLSVKIGSSPSSKVIVGKDQWYFYVNRDDGSSLENYRKNDGLTPEQLRQWKFNLEDRYYWLKEREIPYIFVIAPDKYSIYPEYFPTRIRPIGTQSRLEQLMAYMKDSDVPILDLRQGLIQAKSNGLVYSKTDTHWNMFGAAIAQYEIMQYIANIYPNIHPIRYSAKDFLWRRTAALGIATMLNLSDILKEDANPILSNPLPECEKQMIEEKPKIPGNDSFLTNCAVAAPVALMFRDSFFTTLQPYISPYFSKSIYIWERPNQERFRTFVKKYHPDIVIEERVERWLIVVPPWPRPTPDATILWTK